MTTAGGTWRSGWSERGTKGARCRRASGGFGCWSSAREHIDGPDGRGQVVAQVLSPEAMIERAQHNEWKRQLMRKAAAERDAERRGDARSLTGRFNNLLRAGGR